MYIPVLNLHQAQRLIEQALAAADQQGVAIAATVVDAGGHVVALARMDGVNYMALDVTRRKAITACNFRMPTQVLSVISSADPVAGADIAKNAEICAVPGGMPIVVEGVCVGGLGIGGGRSNQDQAIAEQALASL